jgi:hypothetical protein
MISRSEVALAASDRVRFQELSNSPRPTQSPRATPPASSADINIVRRRRAPHRPGTPPNPRLHPRLRNPPASIEFALASGHNGPRSGKDLMTPNWRKNNTGQRTALFAIGLVVMHRMQSGRSRVRATRT